MSSSDPNDNKRILFLDQIHTQTTLKKKLRFELQVDGKDVEIQQEKGSLIWTPSRCPELENASKITLIIKAGHLPFRKGDQVEFTGQDALNAFWGSTESISREVTLDQQAAVITFRFRPSPTSETTRKAVQELESAMGTYRVLMSDATEQTIDLVFKYGSKLSEINPIISAAFNIASGAFEVLKEQKKYDGMVSELAEWIARILHFATLSLEEIVCDDTELLDRAVRKMCALVADAANFICAHAKQNPGARAINSVATDAHAKITAFRDEFVKLKEDFDRAVNVETLKSVRKTEELRLLDRLKPADGAGYQQDRTCMEGTRTVVLDDVITWALDSKTPPTGSNADNLYWLYGSPGLGKTAVANSLCERLHGSRNLGGSFFCRRDDPILRQPRRVLPSLVSKLAEMWGPYRWLVAQALQDDPQLNPDSAGGEILLNLLQSVQKHPLNTLVLVIDALDECGEQDTRKPLLKSPSEACFQVPWLKIIVTSRPEHDIKTYFEACTIKVRDLAADDPSRKDIALFTKNCMASIAERRHLGDWPGEERLKQIVERSGGLFIFVGTLRRFVDDLDPEPLLAQVLDGDQQDANTGLYTLYSTAISTRVGKHVDKFRSVAQSIVVVAKHRPLCDNTLASLHRLKPPIVKTLIDELSPLLYRDHEEKQGIRVRHLSVIDFLTGPTCPSEFRVDIQEANAELSLCCLTTMTKELKFNICDLETSLLANSEIQGLDQRVDLKVPDSLQYSCMYWSSHLCSGFDPVSMEASVLLDNLFTGPLPLYWIEVLSLMGKVPVAISALRQIKECREKFQVRHREAAEDILRFLLAFTTPISTSTPHIYLSALPFMPTESRLWKNVTESFPKVMNVCKGRMRSWSTLPGVWQGHTSNIHSIAYSRDGQYVVTGSEDGTIRIWDAETGDAVGEPLRGHSSIVFSVAYSPDGRHVVSGSGDRTIRIWNAETRGPVGDPLNGHFGAVQSVAYSPDGRHLVSGSGDGTFLIWDAETGKAVGDPLRGHGAPVSSVAYSPNGRRVVSGSEDMTIRIWDVETGRAAGDPLRGYAEINSVAYSPDGCHIVSGSETGTIRIWNAETGEGVGEPLRGHTTAVLSVSYSPDGRRVVSSSDDKTIRIWDVKTGEAVGQPLRGHKRRIRSVAHSPDGQHVVSGSDDMTIRIWDAETGEAVGEPLMGHAGLIRNVAYSPAGRHVISGSKDRTIRIWDAETGAAVGEPLRGHAGDVLSVAYSPDGRRVASGAEDNTIQIWDVETGEAVGESLRGHENEINSVVYSPDGRHIASGSDDTTIRIWNTETGDAVGEPLRGHSRIVFSVAYSPDGRHIASGSHDSTIRIWDAETRGAVGEPLKGHLGTVYSVAYSPDGQRIVSGSGDGTVRIWDAETREAVGQPLKGQRGYIYSVAYSPDGRYVVSGSGDSTIRIWDTKTGEAVSEPLCGHTGVVYSVAYSPDGQRIVSGSDDRTIRIWGAATGPNRDHREFVPDPSNFPAAVGAITTSLSSNQAFASDLPTRIISPDMLSSDGYVRSTEGLLFWVPEDCRNGITSPAIMTIPTNGRQRSVRVDLTNFQYGTSWTDVYAGVQWKKMIAEAVHQDEVPY